MCLTDDVEVAVRYIVEADRALAGEREAVEEAAEAQLAAEAGDRE